MQGIRKRKEGNIVRIESVDGKPMVFFDNGLSLNYTGNPDQLEKEASNDFFFRIYPKHLINLCHLSKIQLGEKPLVIMTVDVLSGNHRMRAKAVWDYTSTDPCADENDGETEDYTVEIINAGEIIDVGVVSIDIPNTVAPGNVPTLVTFKNYGNTTQTIVLSILNEIYGTST